MGTDDADQPARTVDPLVAAPGGDVTVVVRTSLAAGRTVLREVCPGTTQIVESVEPEPATLATANGSIFVAWDEPKATTGTVHYTCRLPAGEDDTAYDWAGTLIAPDGGTVVGGVQEVPVLANFVDRLLERESIDDAELQTAATAFEDGEVSEERFRQVVEHWRRSPTGSPLDPEPAESKPDRPDGKGWLPW